MSLGQIAQDSRGRSRSGLDGGFGVEGAEVIAGKVDAFSRTGEGCLDAAPAREAVCETERPPAHMRLDHPTGKSRKDVIQVAEVSVNDLAVVEIEQLCGERRRREDHEAASRLAQLLSRTYDAAGIQEDVECPLRRRDRVAAVPWLRSAFIG